MSKETAQSYHHPPEPSGCLTGILPFSWTNGENHLEMIVSVDTNGVSENNKIQEHLEKIAAVRQRLFELDQQIESGDYTVETLREFSEVYGDYLDVRVDRESRQPGLLARVRRLLRLG
jgi:hypothetical protein